MKETRHNPATQGRRQGECTRQNQEPSLSSYAIQMFKLFYRGPKFEVSKEKVW
jgi:hypothetical protein